MNATSRFYGWILWWLQALVSLGLAAQSTPYLGQPLPVPGRIEAEHYDLGGEGIAFHGLGLLVTNAGVAVEFPPGRPGDAISADGTGGKTNVILRTGEWLNFSVDCQRDDYYRALVRTTGPPQYLDRCPPFSELDACWYPGSAVFHLELDGEDVTGPVRLAANTLLPRIWMTAGPHRLRVVMDQVSDVHALGYGAPGPPWRHFSVEIDSMQFLPAVVPMRPVPLAGGAAGFRDGPGAEAQFGAGPVISGELTDGRLVIQDTANAALRTVSREGVVQTLAGFPGNHYQDGVGTQAGFGEIIQSVVTLRGTVLVLERNGVASDGIRRVDPDGTVSTLFSGRPVASFTNPNSGELAHPVIPLSNVMLDSSGEVRALGVFWNYEVVRGSALRPIWGNVGRTAHFHIEDGRATQIALDQSQLPPLQPQNFGDGYRMGGMYSSSRDTLVHEDPPGFEEEVTPGQGFASVYRGTDGTFFCVAYTSYRQISRLVPVTSASRLEVSSIGDGQVNGAPSTLVLPEEDIRLEATPFTRFTRFLGWSDGSRENPRTLRIQRDTRLKATFGLVYPEPNGILGKLVKVAPNRSLQVCLVGSPAPYVYRVMVSRNLAEWKEPPAGTVTLFNTGTISGDIVRTSALQTWLSIPYTGESLYVRVELLDQ